jgi:hypothetical protein
MIAEKIPASTDRQKLETHIKLLQDDKLKSQTRLENSRNSFLE